MATMPRTQTRFERNTPARPRLVVRCALAAWVGALACASARADEAPAPALATAPTAATAGGGETAPSPPAPRNAPARVAVEPYVVTTTAVTIAGRELRTDFYQPAQGEMRGVAIVAHGFNRSRARHRELGIALANAGIVAVIPDLPHMLDFWGNGEAIVELAGLLERGVLAPPP